MSHIYQPLMLMELLGRRSPAPAQDVARRILGEDVTQIDYYTERVKRMVGKVLTGNGITRCERGTYALVGGDELSDAERDQLLELCRQRLDAFRQQRGEEVFAHRSRHRTPISGSIKYRVLTRARGRCECCGAHEHQRALEVDHIVPRNHGGSDCPTTIWLRGRAKQVDRSGVDQLNPVAMRRAPGHACSPQRSPD
ncbi:HNH endonuclease, partial [Cyanobium sp. LEGE 06113]|uniref:HNH endonuclease n=1 Tax=Cyanobium sp. LEGE 06113 TaxID=1297573 RepID=UPI001D150F5A